MFKITRRAFVGAVSGVLLAAQPVLSGAQEAAGITVTNAYARFLPGAKAGAAFMEITNNGTEDDRLVAARSDAAVKVETHTHKAGADGVMQMIHVAEGFAVPAGESRFLERGGDHLMFMGLTGKPSDGDTVHVTLSFERAGEIELDIPVDNAR
ncbi:MAG: copper chaperone PCu(A)C [Rhodobacteraceae bacterium]|nr:copper chaperone PCu(A)C [Paracoccaceae bacterium]